MLMYSCSEFWPLLLLFSTCCSMEAFSFFDQQTIEDCGGDILPGLILNRIRLWRCGNGHLNCGVVVSCPDLAIRKLVHLKRECVLLNNMRLARDPSAWTQNVDWMSLEFCLWLFGRGSR